MDFGKIRIISIVCICFCLWPANMEGQLKNRYDIHFKYLNHSVISEANYVHNIYNMEFPAILGNLNRSRGYEIGLLFSGYSYFFQPGIIFTHLNYDGNQVLNKIYNDIQIKSYGLGLGGKINILGYEHQRATPYIQIFGSYVISSLTNKETSSRNSMRDQSTLYLIDIRTPSIEQIFFNPMVEVSAGVEIRFMDRLFVLPELGIKFRNYPDLDIPSPFLVKEPAFSLGLRYKLARDNYYQWK
jgi:hypothetical protein